MNSKILLIFFIVALVVIATEASRKFEKGLLYGVLLAQAHKNQEHHLPIHEPIPLLCHDDHKW